MPPMPYMPPPYIPPIPYPLPYIPPPYIPPPYMLLPPYGEELYDDPRRPPDGFIADGVYAVVVVGFNAATPSLLRALLICFDSSAIKLPVSSCEGPIT